MASVFHGYKTSTTPGVAVPLADPTGPPVFADWIYLRPRVVGATVNAGEIRLGGPPLAADAGAIPQGSGMGLNAGDSAVAWPIRGYDLRTIYMDVDTSGDGVQYAGAIL